MAEMLELRRDATTIDLLDGDPGWSVVDPGWVPKVCEYVEGRLPPPVVEVLKISGVGFASQDALATAEIALNKMAVAASRYIGDRTEEHPVWLYDQLNAETGQRRALVRKMRIEKLTQQHGVDCEGLILDAEPVFILTIEREPYWERTAATAAASGNNISVLGGVFNYTAGGGVDVVGDVPARLNELSLGSGESIAFTQAWLGFRSANKHGTLANFISKWEAEDGTNATDAADTGDATASGGNRVTINYAGTATWAKRFYLKLSDVTANYADNFGTFKLLVRAKVTAGTSNIRAKYTYLSTSYLSDSIPGPIRQVAGTNWTMYDLGDMNIPLRDLRNITISDLAASLDKEFTLELWSERASGAGHLYIDCFVLIPSDEFFIFADRMEAKTDGVNNEWYAYLYQNVQREISGVSARATPPPPHTLDKFTRITYVSPNGIGVPVGDGRLYICMGASSGGNVHDDQYNIEALSLIPAWSTLRGGE